MRTGLWLRFRGQKKGQTDSGGQRRNPHRRTRLVAHCALAGNHTTNHGRSLLLAIERLETAVHVFAIAHQDHADPHIESAEHFVDVNAPEILNQTEDRRNRPPRSIALRTTPVREHTGEILRDPAALDWR